MSELKVRFIDDTYAEYFKTGKHDLAQVYLKSEADAFISELEESHKKEVAQLLILNREQANAANRLRDSMEQAIRYQKHKRCLLRSVIAEMNATHFKDLFYEAGSEALADEYNKQITIHYKWSKLWMELAEKFKHNNSTAQRAKDTNHV